MARVLPFASLPMAIVLTCTTALTLAGCDRQSAPDKQPQETANVEQGGKPASKELAGKLDRTHLGEAVPTYTFTDPSGTKLKLSDLKGAPVLLNLWATWCAPCVVEMPMLDDLAGKYGEALRVVTVSQDMNGAEAVVPFFRQKGYKHLEPWLDANNDLAFYYSQEAVLPTTILYDGKGKEVWRMVGGYDWGSAEALRLIEEALPGTPSSGAPKQQAQTAGPNNRRGN